VLATRHVGGGTARNPKRVHLLAFDVAVDRLTAARLGPAGPVPDRRGTARPRRSGTGVDLNTVVGTLAALMTRPGFRGGSARAPFRPDGAPRRFRSPRYSVPPGDGSHPFSDECL